MSENFKKRADEFWSGACKHLKEVLHPDVYARWIAIIEPGEYDGKIMKLAVANDFYQTWLEENYLSLIASAIATASGEQISISFVVKPKMETDDVARDEEKKASIRERFFKKPKNEPAFSSQFTFDSFVVGSSNDFAHAAALAVAQTPGNAYNPLLIYGGSGLGKTHLLHAIGHVVQANSRHSVCYTSCEALMNEFVEALQSQGLSQFRRKYRNAGLLLIDDVHFLGRSERLQEEFFHTFNALFEARKQIVMTSDRPTQEIAGLEQRLVTRFDWGLVTELEMPEFETRLAILREKQSGFSRKLGDEFLEFIARSIKSSVRHLEGALVRCISYASLTGKDLDQAAIEFLLRDLLEQQQKELSFDSIQRTVAQYYDVRLADMSSKRRPREVAVPRQVAMYLCRKFTDSSLPDIANAFGKTHATVLHAYKSIDQRMGVDQKLRQDVSLITQKIGKGP